MGLLSLILLDPSGIAIARYPMDHKSEENLQVFSAFLVSFYNTAKNLGFGDLEQVLIGGKQYLVRKISENYYVVGIFDKGEPIEEWFFDLLGNALRNLLNYARDEEGIAKEYEINLFKNVLKKFYEEYTNIINNYYTFKKILKDQYKEKGDRVLEIVNTISMPDLEIWDEDDEIVIKNIRVGDLEKFKEILEKAILSVKE